MRKLMHQVSKCFKIQTFQILIYIREKLIIPLLKLTQIFEHNLFIATHKDNNFIMKSTNITNTFSMYHFTSYLGIIWRHVVINKYFSVFIKFLFFFISWCLVSRLTILSSTILGLYLHLVLDDMC